MTFEPGSEPTFATLDVDPAPEPESSSLGSASIEARGVTVRLDGDIGAARSARIASLLRALRCSSRARDWRVVVATRLVDFRNYVERDVMQSRRRRFEKCIYSTKG